MYLSKNCILPATTHHVSKEQRIKLHHSLERICVCLLFHQSTGFCFVMHVFLYLFTMHLPNRECVNSSSGSDPFGNNSYCCCLFFTMCVQISMDSNNLKLKALSLNVQGIHTFEKRKSLFIWLTKQNSDICFL